MCLYRGWLALFTSNCPRYRPLAWMVHPIDIEPSVISPPSVEGSPLVFEPSVIHAQNVDGSLLRHGPSVILRLSVEGSTPGSRTIRDMCLYRGWLALFTSNCPRYRPLAWTVHPIDIEPSAILRFSVEGSALDSEPSAIDALSVDGSTLVPEPSAIRGRVSLISCNTSNVKTWRKMPVPLGYDEKGSSRS